MPACLSESARSMASARRQSEDTQSHSGLQCSVSWQIRQSRCLDAGLTWPEAWHLPGSCVSCTRPCNPGHPDTNVAAESAFCCQSSQTNSLPGCRSDSARSMASARKLREFCTPVPPRTSIHRCFGRWPICCQVRQTRCLDAGPTRPEAWHLPGSCANCARPCRPG